MITIVIPTLLKMPIDVFTYSLNQYCSCALVEKIIVIDNSEEQIFEKMYSNEKIEVMKNGKNNFVNPAWNMGLERTSTKYYLIVNDDIICSGVILEKLYEVMEDDDEIGVCTVSTEQNMPLPEYLTVKHPETPSKSYEIPNSGRVGWFMFGRVDDWEPIPEPLKIWCGDDFIYERSIKKLNKKNCILEDLKISHFESTSVNKILGKINQILNQDKAWWFKNRDKYVA